MANLIDEDIKPCFDILREYEKIKNFERDVLARPDADEYVRMFMDLNKDEIQQAEDEKIGYWFSADYIAAGQAAAEAA